MMLKGIVLSTMAFCTIALSAAVYADPDPTAGVVYLRTDCTEGGVTVANCVTTMSSLLNWINNTRHPSAANPLVVEIGPGTFKAFNCNGGGYTTLRGSGRQNTIITNGQAYGDAFQATNCTQIDVSELTILGTGTALHTMDWIGGGTSTWSNVDVSGNSYGWWDTGGTHYWFGCRFINKAGYGVSRAYETQGASWFFGSQIEADGPAGNVMALGVFGSGEAHVYGGNVRALMPNGTAGAPGAETGIEAVYAGGTGAQVHLHGTGIDVISGAGNDIAALVAGSGAMIHANGSAYVLTTGTGGTVYRLINNGGDMRAPYVWQSSATPPNIVSITGADQVMITGTGNGHPGMVVYDDSCASKWYDIGAQACH